MLQDLIRRLAGPPAPHPLHPDDARLAMAALMVRISRTDGSYSQAERRRIDAMLIERYRLDAAGAARIRAEAEVAEEGAQDTVQFTRLIKQAVPYEERTGVVEALWRVAATDGINADERGLMRLVSELLGVSDVDSGLARQRALGEGSA
ncbi:MAG: TerB family tellurite resistance protein [Amaricoccus sp.]